MAKSITLPVGEFVVFKGIYKTGEKVGQPYAFAKLDAREANNPAFVEALEVAGAKVISDGAVNGGSANFQVNE